MLRFCSGCVAGCFERMAGVFARARVFALPLSELARRTLQDEEDASAFPCRQFWHQRTSQPPQTWWDLDGLFQHVRQSCNKQQKRGQWLNELQNRVSADLPQDPPFHLRPKEHAPTDVTGLPLVKSKRWVAPSITSVLNPSAPILFVIGAVVSDRTPLP